MIKIFLDKKNTGWTHSNDHPLHQISQRGRKKCMMKVIKVYNAFTLS